MTEIEPDEPIEELLADRLSHQTPDQGPAREPLVQLLRRLGNFDRAAYAAVARMPTPALDEPLRQLSGFANHSKPWLILAGTLAVLGGPQGRRAALTGVGAAARALLLSMNLTLGRS